jgi:hypothetical protein
LTSGVIGNTSDFGSEEYRFETCGVNKFSWNMDELEKLRKENEDLKDKLTDLTFELNYNKQTELIEFVRELYQSLGNVGKNLTKKELVENLRNYIREFTKNNKIQL